MPLHSLLFSRDQEVIALVGEVLKGLDIDMTHCSHAHDAVHKLVGMNFDAIIVDTADARGAVEVLGVAKSSPSCERSIGVVLAASLTSIGLADGARTHMVLYRPLSAGRLRNGIKSALKLRSDGQDARESERTPIKIAATLRGAGQEETLAFIVNLSASGAALQAGRSMPASSIRNIEFFLPNSDENLTSPVELVWRDVQGQMGLRFAGASARFTETLEKWLTAQTCSHSCAAKAASDAG
jgi:hypothetical protein